MKKGVAALLTGALSLVLAVTSAAEFPLLEDVAPPVYEALNPKETDELSEFNTPSFTLYLELRDAAAGARIDISDPSLLVEPGDPGWADRDLVSALERSELIGIAGMVDVSVTPVPELNQEDVDRILAHEVASGEFRQLGRYVLSAAPGPVQQIVVARNGGAVLFMDSRLLDPDS